MSSQRARRKYERLASPRRAVSRSKWRVASRSVSEATVTLLVMGRLLKARAAL